jgi:hypothetical protein
LAANETVVQTIVFSIRRSIRATDSVFGRDSASITMRGQGNLPTLAVLSILGMLSVDIQTEQREGRPGPPLLASLTLRGLLLRFGRRVSLILVGLGRGKDREVVAI